MKNAKINSQIQLFAPHSVKLVWLVICVDSNATTAEATFTSTPSSFFKHCKRKTG